jgi:hypothetical protein
MTRTFTSATDEAFIKLIKEAKERLSVIAPGLTRPVAEALVARLKDLPELSLSVILDADAEVYRLGYGDVEALQIIRKACDEQFFDLREQPGVRIGVVISDENTMIFAPVSRNIEAGSSTEDKPNAIFLGERATEKLAEATGSREEKREIGHAGMTPARVSQMNEDLKRNPPQNFDLTRKLRVFTAEAEFVELSISNYRMAQRRVALPNEFVSVNDDNLKKRISGQLKAPLEKIGPVKIRLEEGGKELEVDEAFINKERQEIEKTFTYVLPKKGRIILKKDREFFDKEVAKLKAIIEKFRKECKKQIDQKREEFTQTMKDEFSKRWQENPPPFLARRELQGDSERVDSEIASRANSLFDQLIDLSPLEITVNYKGIVLQDIQDPNFQKMLQEAMRKANVDQKTIERLFQTGDAAAAKGAFT